MSIRFTTGRCAVSILTTVTPYVRTVTESDPVVECVGGRVPIELLSVQGKYVSVGVGVCVRVSLRFVYFHCESRDGYPVRKNQRRRSSVDGQVAPGTLNTTVPKNSCFTQIRTLHGSEACAPTKFPPKAATEPCPTSDTQTPPSRRPRREWDIPCDQEGLSGEEPQG